MLCITTVEYFVVVNDTFVGPIFPGRGLYRGIHYPHTYLFCVIRALDSYSVCHEKRTYSWE